MKQSRLLLGSVAALSVAAIGAVTLTTFAAEPTTDTEASPAMPMMQMFHHGKGNGETKGFKKVFGGFGMKHQAGPGFMKFGGEGNAAHEAVLAGDYDAFLEATADTPMAESITQEKFQSLHTHAQKMQTVQTAIENNDYEAFVAASTPSPEEFAEIVAQHQTQQLIQHAVEEKDYAAFQTAVAGTPMDAMTEEHFTRMVEKKAKHLQPTIE